VYIYIHINLWGVQIVYWWCICLFICLYVCLSVCWSVCLSVCLSLRAACVLALPLLSPSLSCGINLFVILLVCSLSLSSSLFLRWCYIALVSRKSLSQICQCVTWERVVWLHHTRNKTGGLSLVIRYPDAHFFVSWLMCWCKQFLGLDSWNSDMTCTAVGADVTTGKIGITYQRTRKITLLSLHDCHTWWKKRTQNSTRVSSFPERN